MGNRNNYNTKQRNIVLDYLLDNQSECFTANSITAGLSNKDVKISKTTIYRCLEKFVADGTVIRYSTDNGGAFYRYNTKGCDGHLHLKCLECGCLIHLDCSFAQKLYSHISKQHQFKFDTAKSVFYGTCEQCSKIT